VPNLGPVHEGFYNAFKDVWYDQKTGSGGVKQTGILATLEEWKVRDHPEYQIYVTGHSKGGPMADMAVLELKANGYAVKEVYTFAGARGGGSDFRKNYDNIKVPTQRYENQRDLVPHLPPTKFEMKMLVRLNLLSKELVDLGEFQPVGRLTFIDTSGGVQSPATWEEEKPVDAKRLEDFEAWAAGKPPKMFEEIGAAHNIVGPSKGDADLDHRYHYEACK
jgi:Lipase (class 3)